ncbi:hypothetical protein HYS00_00705 [Candidatus Microgenomates bacterium]|nr:hypothetical protein [Candidatus Microgenomates bacterium]
MTLTELSFYFRKYYPFAILGALFILIVFYTSQLFILFMQNKPRGPAISPIFNVLKRPSVPEASSSADIKFSLENIEGRPVTATDTARVYYLLPPPRTPFGFREKAYLIARAFNFETDTEKVNFQLQGRNAVFTDDTKKLSVDIQNFNFNFQYQFAEQPGLFDTAVPPNTAGAQAQAINFLQSIDVYPQELATGKSNTIFFSFNPQSKTVRPIDEGEEGNMVEVDFSRADIDGYPTVSSTFFNSQNFILMTFFNDGKFQILRAQMKFFQKSSEQFGIYPLRNGDEAYADLQKGEGIIVSNPQNLKTVTLRRMFTAYFDPDVYQDYLQPVYVFIGDDNFVAYVPAVAKQYIAKPSDSPSKN